MPRMRRKPGCAGALPLAFSSMCAREWAVCFSLWVAGDRFMMRDPPRRFVHTASCGVTWQQYQATTISCSDRSKVFASHASSLHSILHKTVTEGMFTEKELGEAVRGLPARFQEVRVVRPGLARL
jgi:hypothetical protein